MSKFSLGELVVMGGKGVRQRRTCRGAGRGGYEQPRLFQVEPDGGFAESGTGPMTSALPTWATLLQSL